MSTTHKTHGFRWVLWVCAAVFLFILFFGRELYFVLSSSAYILSHNITECVCISVAFSLFLVSAFLCRMRTAPSLFICSSLFLTSAYFLLLHILSYPGMPGFKTINTFGITLFYSFLERLTFCGALWFLLSERSCNTSLKLSKAIFFLLAFAVVSFFVPGFVEHAENLFWNNGITLLKKVYTFIIIIFFGFLLFYLKPYCDTPSAGNFYLTALVLSAYSEMCFIMYHNEYDIYLILGHVFKTAGYFFFFIGFFIIYVQAPYFKLKEAQVFYKTADFILNSIDSAVVSINNSMAVTHYNTAAEKIFGISKKQALGANHDSIFGSLPLQHQYLKQTLKYGKIFKSSEVCFNYNNRLLELVIDTALVRGDDNKINGAVAVMKDISETRGYDEIIARTHALAVMGETAAGVVHEIKNSVTSIKGFIELLDRSNAAQPFMDYLRVLRDESNRIDIMVRDFLSLGKKHHPDKRYLNVNQLICELKVLITGEAVDKSQRVRFELREKLPQVLGNAHRLKQVFFNLAKNGLEAMDSGGELVIRTNFHPLENIVCIEFIDTGHGIPDDLRPKIFSPFFTTKEKGTGLGLVLCKKIIHHHGGSLDFTTTPGKGTAFFVKLPVT